MCLILFGFLTGGPYYDLIGRTGNNVGRKLRGKNVFSMRPSPSHKPATTPQINQRLKWSLVTEFLSWITPALNVGFQDYTAGMSAYNAAVSYNLLHAVTGVAPNYMMDYAKVLFSRGPLNNLANPAGVAAANDVVDFSWDSVVNVPYANADDKVSIILFNPAKWQFLTAMDVAVRSAALYTLVVPADYSGDVVQIWFMVTNAKGDEVSTSLFLGALTLL